MTDNETDQRDNRPRERTRRVVWGATAVAGGALVGAILAGGVPAFASSTSPSPSSSATGSAAERGDGDHRGHGAEQALTGTTATKVRAAALAKVPGATVERLEKDSDGAVYEAHLLKSDGSRVTVKLDASFTVTGVETGGPGGRGHGGRDGEVALTGAKAAKAKAAALAKLPGATVVRVETDADGATYEAHVTKADGSEATVKLDATFTVTSVEDGR
jgi:uncharacterized membrane protein YkoI